MPDALPGGFRIELAPGVRRLGDGSVLVGGSPVHLLRLTEGGRRLVDHLAAGAPVPASPGAQRLVRRLLDAGLAHPRPPAGGDRPGISVVVPVRDDPQGLAGSLSALAPGLAVVVVDDASVVPATGAIAAAGGRRPYTTILRRPRRGGPAAARNDGWRATAEPLVAFLDANCEPGPAWLDVLLPHFADPRVGAVAPRVVAGPGPGAPPGLAAYESARSPLDLGPAEASVRPHGPVPYVPAAALVVRRSALAAAGGFDETLLVGEDVDLVWRLATAGWTIRYEPRATVTHPPRRRWSDWLRQRHAYGTSAAPLARRHGPAVAPAAMPVRSAAAWLAVAAGRPRLAAVAATASVAVRYLELGHLPGRGVEALRLAGAGHLRAGRIGAEALRRAWPPAAFALAFHRRSRPALTAALVALPVVEWLRRRPAPPLGLARYVALRLADDLAYATGVWAGCLRERSPSALVPRPAGARRSGDQPSRTDMAEGTSCGCRALMRTASRSGETARSSWAAAAAVLGPLRRPEAPHHEVVLAPGAATLPSIPACGRGPGRPHPPGRW